MKFVVSWTYRLTGSESSNEASIKHGLELFSKWTPPSDQVFQAFVGRLDGAGGFAIVDVDDPKSLADAPSKFGSIAEYQIFPVADIGESMEMLADGVEFRTSVG